MTVLESVGKVLAFVGPTVGNYLSKQHLAIVAVAISGFTLSHQIGVDKLQGESLSLSLSRPDDDKDSPKFIWSDKDQAIETTWDVEVANTSTQAPVTISKWAIFERWDDKFHKVSGTEFLVQDSPFYKLSGEPLPTPITIAAGNTVQLRMKVSLGISQNAAGDLYKFQTDHLSLKRAEELYSWKLNQEGTPKDIFGDEAYDGGYSLSMPEDMLDHLKIPVLRLELQSSRGKIYSALAYWYHFIHLVPRTQWDKLNREQVCAHFATQLAPVTFEIVRWDAELSPRELASICKSLETF